MGILTGPLASVVIAAFLASTVEFVEAFTIVLVVGVTINWRSSFLGAALAALTLAVLVGIFGTALIAYVPINVFRIAVGLLLTIFGMKWLKKAILRYSGVKALHDEEAIYEEQVAAMRALGEHPSAHLDPFGVATSYKSVLLEGLEVAFIVISFGSGAVSGSVTKPEGIAWAAIGAVAALALVVALGAIVRAPLQKVPENTLKFTVGVMLASFGTFWGGEGLGIKWPGNDLFLLALIGFYLLICLGLVALLKPYGNASASAHKPVVPAIEEAR